MTQTLDQLLYLIENVYNSAPRSYFELVEARRIGLHTTASAFGVHQNTVRAKFNQTTHTSTGEFDTALWKWVGEKDPRSIKEIIHRAIPPNEYRILDSWFANHP